MIRLSHISKKFTLHRKSPTFYQAFKRSLGSTQKPKEIWALRDICLDIRQGEKIGIAGDNGSGKTSLLRIIGGIYAQTSGILSLKGRVATLLNLGMGMQRELSGWDNISLFGAIMGLPYPAIQDRLNEIIRFSDLGEEIHAPLREYSMGMIQRLAVAILLEANAPILLMDEIFNGSDFHFREKCLHIFRSPRFREKTVLFASHSLDLMEAFCDKMLLLQNGRPLHFGPTQECVRFYKRLRKPQNRAN